MGLISNMETVFGREIARLILLIFILIVLYTGFIALLVFLFFTLGPFNGFFSPILASSTAGPILFLGGIFFVIPVWLIIWRFLGKFKFEKNVFVNEK